MGNSESKCCRDASFFPFSPFCSSLRLASLSQGSQTIALMLATLSVFFTSLSLLSPSLLCLQQPSRPWTRQEFYYFPRFGLCTTARQRDTTGTGAFVVAFLPCQSFFFCDLHLFLVVCLPLYFIYLPYVYHFVSSLQPLSPLSCSIHLAHAHLFFVRSQGDFVIWNNNLPHNGGVNTLPDRWRLHAYVRFLAMDGKEPELSPLSPSLLSSFFSFSLPPSLCSLVPSVHSSPQVPQRTRRAEDGHSSIMRLSPSQCKHG